VADNTQLSTAVGAGDTIRDIDRGGIKTTVAQLDIGGAAAEQLVTGAIPAVGLTIQLSANPVIQAALYAAGNSVGGLLTFNNAYRGVTNPVTLQDLIVTDKSGQNAPLTILFFDSNPTNGNYADKTAVTFGTDFPKIIGKVNVQTTDYDTINAKGIAHIKNISAILVPNATTTLYAVIVTTGTPTYVSTSDITLKLKLYQD
jgi:hypothetical protein